jgi:outer membrane protein assembly factor BamB
MSRLAIVFGCALAFAARGAGADWPMFRGAPGLSGVAAGSLPEKPSLLWSFKTGGPVRSSAAIVDGRVFIGSDDGKLYALTLAEGRKLWETATNNPIASSPLVLDGRVFVGSDGGAMLAFNARDGNLAWKLETGDKIPGSANYVKAPGGTNHWIVFGSYDSLFRCVDAATGRTNWVVETGTGINGTPSVSEGLVAIGGCDAVLHLLKAADGTKVKEVEIGAPMLASAAMTGGRAYVGHFENEFVCVDVRLGTNVWTYRDKNFAFVSSPAVTEDRVLFGSRDKSLHCLNRADGKSVWSFPTRGRVDSSPVVCGDKVVVGSDDGRVYVVSLAEGRELWSYDIGQPLSSSPAVAEGRIVIGSDDGSVYCFGTK